MIFTTETNKNRYNKKETKFSVDLGDAQELLFHLNSINSSVLTPPHALQL